MHDDHHLAARSALLNSARARLARPWCTRSRAERFAIVALEIDGLDLAASVLEDAS